MNIKKFYGKSSREALIKVKATLGENAIILANRSINGGTEIVAVSEEEMLKTEQHELAQAEDMVEVQDEQDIGEVSFFDFVSRKQQSQTKEASSNAFNKPTLKMQPQAPKPAFTSKVITEPSVNTETSNQSTVLPIQKNTHLITNDTATNVTESQHTSLESGNNVTQETTAAISETLDEFGNNANTLESEVLSTQTTEEVTKATNTDNTEVKAEQADSITSNESHLYQIVSNSLEDKMQAMMSEMREMRHHFESQMHAITWQHHLQHNPAKSKVLSSLLAANFSASLSRQIAEKLPNHITADKAPEWAKNIVNRNLHVMEDESIILDKGGVYALVGPTGVGKTTTTAKLAARYVMKHGTKNIGLITTDSYKIGGHEQLRIYGKILGAVVHAVKDKEELNIALKELSNKHIILIDTVGVSQRDQAIHEQLSMLNHCDVPIEKILCVSATATGETLTDVVSTYKPFKIHGCIVTKLDEAASIGSIIDVLIREHIQLLYTTSGQRVPEDIEVANKNSLIDRVLLLNKASWPYQYLEEELPLVVSNIYLDHTKQELNHAS